MSFLWQYQGHVEPLWSEDEVDFTWYQEAEYPAAYLAPPPSPEGISVEPIWPEDEVPFEWQRLPEYPAAYLIPPPRDPGWYCGQELDEDGFAVAEAVTMDMWWRQPSEPVWVAPNHYWTLPSLSYAWDPGEILGLSHRRTAVGHAVLQVASGDVIRVRMMKLEGTGTVYLAEDGSSLRITVHDFS
jgi:hypothetical protein